MQLDGVDLWRYGRNPNNGILGQGDNGPRSQMEGLQNGLNYYQKGYKNSLYLHYRPICNISPEIEIFKGILRSFHS